MLIILNITHITFSIQECVPYNTSLRAMNSTQNNECITTVPDGVGDAVGVSETKWFVAIVKNNTEKSSREKLDKLGLTTYLPTQKETRVWKNGKRAIVERVVISSIIFINCTEDQRKEVVNLPFINRFMTNKAGTPTDSNTKPLAIIPDSQIKTLQFMLGNSDSPVTISSRPFRKGDKVRVFRGKLKGLEGEVINLSTDKTELVVGLDFFGCARLTIDTINVEVIK